jgi:L-xylulokinase
MSQTHIIAFDAGGTAVKAALYNERGEELAVAGAVMAPLHPAPGCLERDPEAMWSAICDISRKVLAASAVAPSSIVAVGLTGYGNALYLVDRDGKPVRNGILSPDLRAEAYVARWRASGAEDAIVPITYQRLWPGKPAPLIAWLDANEPESLARAEHAMFCKDYLRFRLTGAIGLDVSDLSSGGLADQAARRFAPEVLDCFGLGRYARLYGEGLEPLTVFGAVSREAAAATGLVAGTPVSTGYADGPAMALGLGAIDESLISVIAGTWGLNQLASRVPVKDGSINALMLGPRPGEFILNDAAPTSASTFEWFVDSVVAAADGAHRDHAALFAFCDEQAARVGASESGPYFLPYLTGRIDQPKARASFVGLASWHGLPEMIRAVFEGVAFEHRRHIDHLLRGRARPRAVRFAGGAARSGPWLEIFGAALDLPLELAAASELGALGAAIVAAVGVGLYPDLETAVAAMTRVRGRIEPDRALVDALARRRAIYGELCEALKPTWARL